MILAVDEIEVWEGSAIVKYITSSAISYIFLLSY